VLYPGYPIKISPRLTVAASIDDRGRFSLTAQSAAHVLCLSFASPPSYTIFRAGRLGFAFFALRHFVLFGCFPALPPSLASSFVALCQAPHLFLPASIFRLCSTPSSPAPTAVRCHSGFPYGAVVAVARSVVVAPPLRYRLTAVADLCPLAPLTLHLLTLALPAQWRFCTAPLRIARRNPSNRRASSWLCDLKPQTPVRRPHFGFNALFSMLTGDQDAQILSKKPALRVSSPFRYF